MIFLNENGLRQEGVVNVCGIVGCGLDRVYNTLKKPCMDQCTIQTKKKKKKKHLFSLFINGGVLQQLL